MYMEGFPDQILTDFKPLETREMSTILTNVSPE